MPDDFPYYILDSVLGEPYCGLWDAPATIKRLRPPSIGESSAGFWPTMPRFKMEKSLPERVPDFISNAFRYLMISTRAKKWLEKNVSEKIEYLPFQIVDLHSKTLPDTYWVANVLGSIPAVDLEKSQGRPDALYPTYYDKFNDLHVDWKRIPSGTKLFRLAEFPQKILIHQSLKEKIENEKLEGALFTPPTGKIR